MPKAPAARSPPKSSTKAPHRGAADASHPAVPANAEPALTPEELAIRKADDARTLLEHRRDNARYFDTARVLGPQVSAAVAAAVAGCSRRIPWADGFNSPTAALCYPVLRAGIRGHGSSGVQFIVDNSRGKHCVPYGANGSLPGGIA